MLGCYLPPHSASALESITAEIGHMPRGAEILIDGDFNTNLESPDGNKSNKVITESMEELEDTTKHFLPYKLPLMQDGRMSSMLRHGQEVRYQTDYILGTERCLFHNVDVRDPMQNTDN